MPSIYDLYHFKEPELFASQTQKSEVERVHMHKDYGSMHNSHNDDSVHNGKVNGGGRQNHHTSFGSQLKGSQTSKLSSEQPVKRLI
jgi:hypothetical protein